MASEPTSFSPTLPHQKYESMLQEFGVMSQRAAAVTAFFSTLPQQNDPLLVQDFVKAMSHNLTGTNLDRFTSICHQHLLVGRKYMIALSKSKNKKKGHTLVIDYCTLIEMVCENNSGFILDMFDIFTTVIQLKTVELTKESMPEYNDYFLKQLFSFDNPSVESALWLYAKNKAETFRKSIENIDYSALVTMKKTIDGNPSTREITLNITAKTVEDAKRNLALSNSPYVTVLNLQIDDYNSPSLINFIFMIKDTLPGLLRVVAIVMPLDVVFKMKNVLYGTVEITVKSLIVVDAPYVSESYNSDTALRIKFIQRKPRVNIMEYQLAESIPDDVFMQINEDADCSMWQIRGYSGAERVPSAILIKTLTEKSFKSLSLISVSLKLSQEIGSNLKCKNLFIDSSIHSDVFFKDAKKMSGLVTLNLNTTFSSWSSLAALKSLQNLVLGKDLVPPPGALSNLSKIKQISLNISNIDTSAHRDDMKLLVDELDTLKRRNVQITYNDEFREFFDREVNKNVSASSSNVDVPDFVAEQIEQRRQEQIQAREAAMRARPMELPEPLWPPRHCKNCGRMVGQEQAFYELTCTRGCVTNVHDMCWVIAQRKWREYGRGNGKHGGRCCTPGCDGTYCSVNISRVSESKRSFNPVEPKETDTCETHRNQERTQRQQERQRLEQERKAVKEDIDRKKEEKRAAKAARAAMRESVQAPAPPQAPKVPAVASEVDKQVKLLDRPVTLLDPKPEWPAESSRAAAARPARPPALITQFPLPAQVPSNQKRASHAAPALASAFAPSVTPVTFPHMQGSEKQVFVTLDVSPEPTDYLLLTPATERVRKLATAVSNDTYSVPVSLCTLGLAEEGVLLDFSAIQGDRTRMTTATNAAIKLRSMVDPPKVAWLRTPPPRCEVLKGSKRQVAKLP